MRTLGDLRSRLSVDLDLPSDRMDLWIAPSPKNDESGGGTGSGGGARGGAGGAKTEPEEPVGERAVFDNMSLAHYGLGHGGVVDVRLRPPSKEKAPAGGAAAGAKDSAAATVGGGGSGGGCETAPAADDVVRVTAKTNGMMLRNEDGVVRVLQCSMSGCCCCYCCWCRCFSHVVRARRLSLKATDRARLSWEKIGRDNLSRACPQGRPLATRCEKLTFPLMLLPLHTSTTCLVSSFDARVPLSPSLVASPCSRQGLFASKSTFGLDLLKRLATRALRVPLSHVTRVGFDKRRPGYSSYVPQRRLHQYDKEISDVSQL